MAKFGSKAKAKAKAEEKPEIKEEEGEVEETTELVVTDGRSFDVLASGDSVFTNQLTADMDPEERKAKVREVLSATETMADRLNLVQGELLYEVTKNQYWKDWTFQDDEGEERPFSDFKEYCEGECGISQRKGRYLVSIYEKFVKDLDLPKEILMDLEWSKAKELISIINAENWKDLLDETADMSVRQVKELVASRKPTTEGKPGKEGDVPEVTKPVTFKLAPEQLENVTNALKIAEGMSGSDKRGNQLDLICSDFVGTSAGASGVEGGLAKLDIIIKNVERAFGVKLEVTEVDEERYSELEGEEAEEGEPVAAAT